LTRYSICFSVVRCARFFSLAVWFALGLAGTTPAVEVPPEGACPPYPLPPGSATPPSEDVIPPVFTPGEHIKRDEMNRLRNYLPREIWQRRETFFYEGMHIQVGPCHRRYPVPEFFRKATEENRARVRLDEEGNLLGYPGEGLPFSPETIDDVAPDAGWKWAWSYRYRYQGSGFRGKFRIIHLLRRGRKTERFEGDFFLLPMHGYPGAGEKNDDTRFWAGGSFEEPPMSRGIAWRQIRKEETDREFKRSDDVWVWMPDERRVRRAAPFAVGGIFMPTYTRGQQAGGARLFLPDGGSTPGTSVGITEHQRRGFVGLLLRPNAYRFRFLRTQDVLAPINSDLLGYPLNPEASYGPSGLSVANGRWELRRAVVVRGQHKNPEENLGSITLYIDALTQAPLYMITRKRDELVKEVGIFMGRFTADDPLAPKWEGSGEGFGTILPIAESVFVAGEGGWLRESFDLRSDPPSQKERQHLTTTIRLERGH
jgi:hypothetical protein